MEPASLVKADKDVEVGRDDGAGTKAAAEATNDARTVAFMVCFGCLVVD